MMLLGWSTTEVLNRSPLIAQQASSVVEGKSGDEFNSENAELYDTLAHPSRILILKALSDHPEGFAELKRTTGIESSGNLSFHLNKLGRLVKTNTEGKYCLTDEGREATRVVDATERLSLEDGSERPRQRVSNVRRNVRRNAAGILLVAALVLGIAMVVTGPFLASQTQVAQGQSSTISPTNFTLPPGGSKFLFGQGGPDIYGVRRLVYLGVISPAVNTAEFQIVAIGATNSTIYSTQSDYVSTDFTIPIGTREVNFSISNPTAAPITIVVVYTSVLGVDRPNQNLGQLLLYLGIGIIVASVGASCAWVFARYRRKAEDQSLSPPLVRQ